MSAPSDIPALPWGARPESAEQLEHGEGGAEEEEGQQEKREEVTIESLGLKLGDRIEVMWIVKAATDEFSRSKWWPATICEMDPNEPIWKVDFSDDEDEDYEEEEGGVEEQGTAGAGTGVGVRTSPHKGGRGTPKKVPANVSRGQGEAGDKEGASKEGAGGKEVEGKTGEGQGEGKEGAAGGASGSGSGRPVTAMEGAAEAEDRGEEEEGPPEGWERPKHIYGLRYDEDEGFEQEVRNVSFTEQHWLFDLRSGAELAFRQPGDEWRPLLGPFPKRTREEAERALADASSDVLETFSHLGPAKQRLAATALRDVMDAMAEMVRSKEEGSILEVEDVHEMFRELKRRRFG